MNRFEEYIYTAGRVSAYTNDECPYPCSRSTIRLMCWWMAGLHDELMTIGLR